MFDYTVIKEIQIRENTEDKFSLIKLAEILFLFFMVLRSVSVRTERGHSSIAGEDSN